MNRFFRSALFPLILIVGAVFLVSQLLQSSSGSKTKPLTYSQLIHKTKANEVQEVTFSPNSQQITFKLKVPPGSPAGTKPISGKVNYPSPESEANYETILQGHHVLYSSKGTGGSAWVSILVSLLPFVFFIAIWIFLMNQMQGGGSRVMSFGKSRAKRMTPDAPKITFRDVAGVDEAVEELQEIKEFLENPKKFQ
ncbi:MAG: ATP-dependent metallopeptidase FtsH/Yme1/Tma family protein, partial [Gaiellaceae bacterium]